MRELINRIDHMALVYMVLALLVLLIIVLVLFFRQRRNAKDLERVSQKLDNVVDQVLKIGDESDYNVRKKRF